jgi:hypothetical protein
MASRKHSKPLLVAQAANEAAVLTTTASPTRAKALVFVSHDSRDADLAEAFANLLSDVSGGTLKSFRSSDKKGGSGIEFGAEWYTAIMSQLDEATDVVALLTAQSIDRPWILYEAGVAKGKLETTVFGVALGVPLEKVSTGPFGQFQNCGDDEDSLTSLVMQLLRRNPDAAPRDEAVRSQVRIFRQNVERILKTRGKLVTSPPASDEQNVAKLFEEVKAMVRELPERVDSRNISVSRRGLGRRFHPDMIEELMFRPFFPKDGMAYSWLIVLSLLRDDYPWLYEPGMDFYRALQRGKPQEIRRAREALMRLVEFTTNSKFMYRLLRERNEESAFVLRRLGGYIGRFMRGASGGDLEEEEEEEIKVIRKED